MTLKYTIEFFSYWHVSSGLSGATYADVLVNKNEYGFPYIPGKTIKGLLREAATEINRFNPDLVTMDFIHQVFGQKPDIVNGESSQASMEGLAFFTSANLSDYLTHNIEGQHKDLLYRVLASTKIEENGIAEDKTLRQLEVSIPMTLHAQIEQFPDAPGYIEQLEYCFKWMKRLGLNRNRGLGRCKLFMN